MIYLALLAGMMRWGDEFGDKITDDRIFFDHPMMMGWTGTNGIWLFGILWLLTWVLFIAVLFALFRWLWKKGENETRRR